MRSKEAIARRLDRTAQRLRVENSISAAAERLDPPALDERAKFAGHDLAHGTEIFGQGLLRHAEGNRGS